MNNYPASVQMTREVIDRAADQIVELQLTAADRLTGPGGRTFGTQDLNRAERIEAFILDAESGALDILKQIAPHHYDAQVRQFERDVAATSVVRGL